MDLAARLPSPTPFQFEGRNVRRVEQGTAQTMSSREIAELVEKRHDNVKRTIETLADRGVIVRPQIEDEPSTDTMGRQRVEAVYRIGKRDSYVIVAQLSPEFTARLVDRWQELEAQAGPTLPNFNSPAVAARAWAEQYEGRELAEQRVAVLEPKAEFYDRFVKADGLYGYQEAGTAAGCYPNKFCDWLKVDHLFYRGKKLMPRSVFVRMGLFEIKPELDSNGDSHLRGWVTPKGVEYFATRAPDSVRVSPRPSAAVKS